MTEPAGRTTPPFAQATITDSVQFASAYAVSHALVVEQFDAALRRAPGAREALQLQTVPHDSGVPRWYRMSPELVAELAAGITRGFAATARLN